ncbi:MAG: hypothetical protein ACXVIJ_05345 [Thermoanaerobaculia bacterium]
MKKLFFLLLIWKAAAGYAADVQRPAFPDDFTPTNCPTIDCRSYKPSEMRSSAASTLGLSLDEKWLQAHLPELQPDFEVLCRKITSCFATPPNNNLFCLDIISSEFTNICDRHFDKEKMPQDHQACFETVETYLLGLDQRMGPRFEATRACAEKNDPVRTNKTLDVWMVPSTIKLPAKLVPMTVFAIDKDTHVPVMARMTIQGQIVYAPANPAGWTSTGYPFKWPVKYVRVPNAQGHEDSVAPTITLDAEGYPQVVLRMPVDAPRVIVSMQPDAAKLLPGKNYRVTVTAKDATTGEIVYGRVMAGNMVVGATNQSFELDLRKKKQRPEIWVAEPSNSASDYVVAPAGE